MPGPLHNVQPTPAKLDHPVWGEIAPSGGRGGFLPREFRYPELMDVGFLRLLYRIRQRAGVPFRVISDFRDPLRNAAAGGALQSAHMERPCRAVDLHVVSNFERFQVVSSALAEGVLRIGIYPGKPDGSGTVHLDTSELNPAPRIWIQF